MTVELHGYRYSVYTWIARLALREKGVPFLHVEIDPFAPDVPPEYLKLHPFKRVPAFRHGTTVIYETSAITRYIDEAFPGPRLQPLDPVTRARANQLMSVVDNYCYWPLVRQVFSHGVFRQRTGRSADQSEYRAGLEAAPRALVALNDLAREGGSFICDDHLTLADIHLAPMIDYFTTAPEGDAMLAIYPKLQTWWHVMSKRPSFEATKPTLPLAPC